MKITAAVVEHKGGKFHMRDDIDLCKLGATVSNFKPGDRKLLRLQGHQRSRCGFGFR